MLARVNFSSYASCLNLKIIQEKGQLPKYCTHWIITCKYGCLLQPIFLAIFYCTKAAARVLRQDTQESQFWRGLISYPMLPASKIIQEKWQLLNYQIHRIKSCKYGCHWQPILLGVIHCMKAAARALRWHTQEFQCWQGSISLPMLPASTSRSFKRRGTQLVKY